MPEVNSGGPGGPPGGGAGQDAGVDARLDISGDVCPITFVKVQAALEELDEGQVLEVRLNDGEPIQNVPRSLKDDGHRVSGVTRADGQTWLLRVVKNGLSLS